ncbi:unnamed protein product [Arabis nemorensis]|uniref:TF-B3 domain-containing protein n=1 Tax=Arabis nemorensis TaxID=586526 RepID=A0A565ARG1_9BRAS|nr:unnamed protein product [Arabis nemorensis]
MVDPDLVGVCSELMRKQLVVSDVKGSLCRLMLGTTEVKKMMLSVFEKTESVGTDGLQVSVYGTNGKVYEMMLKMWNKNTVPVLMNALWNKFVADYGLMKYSDFLTVWMFRHRESGKICLAIDYTRFDSITKKLSPRISKLVFKNPN